MNHLAEILEHELEEAVEIKNKKSLHRYVILLADNVVQKSTYQQNTDEVKSDIKVLAETMKVGFQAVDKRFEDMNKRFEDMNKRFNMMFTFMNIGFGIIILLTVLFRFVH